MRVLNNKRQLISPLLLFMAVMLLLVACDGKGGADAEDKKEIDPNETATTGEATIGCDETLRPIGRQISNAFMNMYPEAKINVIYQPENDLFQSLLDDSVRLILAGRDLSAGEKARISQEQIVAKTTVLGTDAMAVVIHPDNPHDSLGREQLEKILSGKLTSWEELGTGQTGDIVLVFDHAKTGAIRFLQENILPEGDTILGKAYAAKGHEDLVAYVANNPQAIGFIGGSWVTDEDQPLVKEFLSKVKLARLQTPDTSDAPGAYVRPFQSELALRRYPLSRTFYAHSREYYSGLGTGFVVYAAGEHGQRIILKAGLNPEFPPPRYVIFPESEEE